MRFIVKKKVFFKKNILDFRSNRYLAGNVENGSVAVFFVKGWQALVENVLLVESSGIQSEAVII